MIALHDGSIAVAFNEDNKIRVYDKKGQLARSRSMGPVAIRDTAPLSDNSVLVLDKLGKYHQLIENRLINRSPLRILLPEADTLAALSINDKGNIYALYENDLLEFHSGDGRYLRTLPVHSSRDHPPSNDRTRFLINRYNTVKLVEVTVNSQRALVSDVDLPLADACSRCYGTQDREGNIYIAYIQDQEHGQFVSIDKYSEMISPVRR